MEYQRPGTITTFFAVHREDQLALGDDADVFGRTGRRTSEGVESDPGNASGYCAIRRTAAERRVRAASRSACERRAKPRRNTRAPAPKPVPCATLTPSRAKL